jgi:hypothetical protein
MHRSSSVFRFAIPTLFTVVACTTLILGLLPQNSVRAQTFDLSEYTASEGLTAATEGDRLLLKWTGANDDRLGLAFAIQDGTPTVIEVTVNDRTCARALQPEYRIATGRRRLTMQQMEPLTDVLGMEITDSMIQRYQWDAFWDAPLYLSDEPPLSHASSLPPAAPVGSQPGLPRDSTEVSRARAEYAATGARIVSRGESLEVIFDGVTAGPFRGELHFRVFRGSGLIRQMIVASTEEQNVAFKYAGGLRGLPASRGNRIVWNDLTGRPQDYRMGGPTDARRTVVKTNNRLLAAELDGAGLAAFPPPHSFYWARESEQNLGYGWYRKDAGGTFAFGIRQADGEQDPEFYHNFALYSARPGTDQRMPVFYYLSDGGADKALQHALDLTNGDRFPELEGYKVMGHHYHVGLVRRLKEIGSFDQRINDVGTMRGVGIDIFSVIDGARGPGRKLANDLYLNDLDEYYEAARRQSDTGFLLMPSDENSTGGRRPFLGGHYELLPSHPIYWRPNRDPGEPLYEEHPKYGTVYNLGEPSDLMEMCERENVLVSMAHPDAKRSTGYPYAIWDTDYFRHPRFFGLGWRWGMGIDGSETRLGEYRFQRLWDETNHYLAQQGFQPKSALAISEARSDLGDRGKPAWDDTYGMSPVNYLRLDTVPGVDDMTAIVEALRTNDFFVTSGEVLLPEQRIEGEGDERTYVAEVHWSFPLEFVELVLGGSVSGGGGPDVSQVQRVVVEAEDTGVHGQRTFRIPFTVGDHKWVRFAAWDVATNGAMGQPKGL